VIGTRRGRRPRSCPARLRVHTIVLTLSIVGRRRWQHREEEHVVAEGSRRLLLIDLENSVGPSPRPAVLRSRVQALLAAAGPTHHAVAGYASADLTDDPTASMLAQLGVAPLRTSPAPDSADAVLLAHARRAYDAVGCRTFVVASADRRFAELAPPRPIGTTGMAGPADRSETRRCGTSGPTHRKTCLNPGR
jgi:hypothetical protein